MSCKKLKFYSPCDFRRNYVVVYAMRVPKRLNSFVHMAQKENNETRRKYTLKC